MEKIYNCRRNLFKRFFFADADADAESADADATGRPKKDRSGSLNKVIQQTTKGSATNLTLKNVSKFLSGHFLTGFLGRV